MITALTPRRREGREEGFTLVELLVVIGIIGILAAIAVPTLINQRRQAYNAAVQSTLRNAAIAQEAYAADGQGGRYAQTVADLEGQGLTSDANITFTIEPVAQADSSTWCSTAVYAGGGATSWAMGSRSGQPVADGTCADDGTVSS